MRIFFISIFKVFLLFGHFSRTLKTNEILFCLYISGTETVMADIEHPKLMILAVLADRKPLDLHMFRNYQSPQEILSEYNGTFSEFGFITQTLK